MSVRNFWSLNVDELLVADKIMAIKDKRHQIFFPLNSTLADIDLVLVNLDSYKTVSIQVKGSRTYEPRKSETKRYGSGGATWFLLSKDKIIKPSNKVDYYIFVLHSFLDGELKKEIQVNFMIVPIEDLKRICEKKKTRSKDSRYDFFIWIDPCEKRAFDIENGAGKEIEMSKFLNNWDLLKI